MFFLEWFLEDDATISISDPIQVGCMLRSGGGDIQSTVVEVAND